MKNRLITLYILALFSGISAYAQPAAEKLCEKAEHVRFGSGDQQGGAKMFKAVTVKYPKAMCAYEGMVAAYRALNDLPKALEAANLGVKNNPNSYRAYILRADVYKANVDRDMNNPSAAIDDLKIAVQKPDALKLEPCELAKFESRLVYLLAEEKRYQERLEYARIVNRRCKEMMSDSWLALAESDARRNGGQTGSTTAQNTSNTGTTRSATSSGPALANAEDYFNRGLKGLSAPQTSLPLQQRHSEPLADFETCLKMASVVTQTELNSACLESAEALRALRRVDKETVLHFGKAIAALQALRGFQPDDFVENAWTEFAVRNNREWTANKTSAENMRAAAALADEGERKFILYFVSPDNLSAAKTAVDRALALDPMNMKAVVYRAGIREIEGDYRGAADDYETAWKNLGFLPLENLRKFNFSKNSAKNAGCDGVASYKQKEFNYWIGESEKAQKAKDWPTAAKAAIIMASCGESYVGTSNYQAVIQRRAYAQNRASTNFRSMYASIPDYLEFNRRSNGSDPTAEKESRRGIVRAFHQMMIHYKFLPAGEKAKIAAEADTAVKYLLANYPEEAKEIINN